MTQNTITKALCLYCDLQQKHDAYLSNAISIARTILEKRPCPSSSKMKLEVIVSAMKLAEELLSINEQDKAARLSDALTTLPKIIAIRKEQRIGGVQEAWGKYHILSNTDPLTNLFDILFPFSETRYELRHTKILAYFLNPKENRHFLGQRLTIPFLNFLCQKANIKLDFVNLKLLRVTPELKRGIEGGTRTEPKIDIVIELITQDEQSYSFFIEAKIDSRAADDQLEDYEIVAKDKEFGHSNLFFLTLDSEKNGTNLKGWINIEWIEIVSIITGTLRSTSSTGWPSEYLKMWLSTILHCWYDLPDAPDNLHHLSTEQITNLHKFFKIQGEQE